MRVTVRLSPRSRDGRSQAVRILYEFGMEGTEVRVRKDGDALILTPSARIHCGSSRRPRTRWTKACLK